MKENTTEEEYTEEAIRRGERTYKALCKLFFKSFNQQPESWREEIVEKAEFYIGLEFHKIKEELITSHEDKDFDDIINLKNETPHFDYQERVKQRNTFFEKYDKYKLVLAEKISIRSPEIEIFIRDLYINQPADFPKVFERNYVMIGEDLEITYLLNIKLNFIRAFLVRLLDYYIETTNDSIKKLSRVEAAELLITYYQASIDNKETKLNLLSNLVFTEFKINISKETSDLYASEIINILQERILSDKEVKTPRKYSNKRKEENGLTVKQTCIISYYLQKHAVFSPKASSNQIGRAMSELTGYNERNLRNLEASYIEQYLEEGGNSRMKYGNAYSVIDILDSIKKSILEDLEEIK